MFVIFYSDYVFIVKISFLARVVKRLLANFNFTFYDFRKRAGHFIITVTAVNYSFN